MFRTVPLSGVFHCTHSKGICHTGLMTACEQDHDGENSTCFGQFRYQEFFTVHTAKLYVIQV